MAVSKITTKITTQSHVEFLRELLPSGSSPLRINTSGIASSAIPKKYFSHAEAEEILLACWDEREGEVTLAGYTLPGGRCMHLWRGFPTGEGKSQAWEMFHQEGLFLKKPTEIKTPEIKTPEIKKKEEDILDLFG